jgi:uncharacterized membrane protein
MIKDTNPAHWKLGFLYYSPEQPRLLVAKRYGSPWTLNFARPAAWAIVAIPLVIMTVGAIVDLCHRVR